MPRKPINGTKGPLPPLDALSAALESARNAQEGNLKLAKAVDTLRTGLETIYHAEYDNEARRAVTAADLRGLAKKTLDAYSQQVGQSWKRNPLIGDRSGDRDLSNLEA